MNQKNTIHTSELFAKLGDLHLGVKNDDPWMEQVILDTIKWFTDDCKRRGIKYCLQAGDWFDVRKGISQRTMEFMREQIAPLFQETFDMTYVLVGNHDMHYRHEITPNSCFEVLSKLDKFYVIQEPETIDIEGIKVDMIPWICKSNEDKIFDFIKNSTSPYCMGHFELNGALFYKGAVASGCEDPDFLKDYVEVWSGHFHTTSRIGNAQYLGTPYTITLGDANDVRGYWIYNSETRESTFNPNPEIYHRRIYFDADTWSPNDDEGLKLFANKVVKIVIEKAISDNKKVNIDRVLDDLERICHELKHEYNEEMALDQTLEVEEGSIVSTLSFIEEQVNILDESDAVRNRILKIFNGLLSEAE